MRLLFALPGFHRYDRGAETALIALATELAGVGLDITLIGSGEPRPGTPYRYLQAGSIRREHFERLPSVPVLREDTSWEELTFVPGLLRNYRPSEFDFTITCAYPFTNWALRRPVAGRPPRHIFVTQNGDWPAFSDGSEYRFFGCDGLVCTNPDFFERNRSRWQCALIPNGIDLGRFRPGSSDRARFGLPDSAPVVLMVSALIDTKRVADGIRAVAKTAGAHLAVAGDGPLRAEVTQLAAELLPGRFTRISLSAAEMPALYRSADVFLHMSKVESFGNVYLEALACGLPVIGHDSPRLRWILGDAGLLVDTEDLDAVARAIREAPARAAPLAERLARAARFAWAEVAGQYRAFFAELSSEPVVTEPR